MMKTLYRNAGSNIIFGKPDIFFSEGCAVGGSTVINGGMSWRASDRVLKRWVWEHDLPESLCSTKALEPVYERVEQMIHVAPQSKESVGEDSRLLKRGCDVLGYRTTPAMRNQRDCVGTNNCIFGCPSGAKQSMLVSYLPRAVRAGARIYADTRIERLLAEASGRVTGAVGKIRNPYTGMSEPVLIRANTVVCAGGAVQTPVLLAGSRLGNRWVGRNLLVHPNAKAVAIYDQEVVGWQGTIQGYQVHEFLDEGLMMATTFVPPALLVASLPYFGDELMAVMRDFNRMVTAGVLVEDSTSGRVRRGPGGQAIMTYRLTPRDLAQMLRGLALLTEIYFASGAKRVLLPIEGLPSVDSPDEIAKIFSYPLDPTELEVLTVHAMGTARLSSTPERGACDARGQVWGHDSLYVADASLFPAPLGVNPQLTIMALATQVAAGIAEERRAVKVA